MALFGGFKGFVRATDLAYIGAANRGNIIVARATPSHLYIYILPVLTPARIGNIVRSAWGHVPPHCAVCARWGQVPRHLYYNIVHLHYPRHEGVPG